MSRKKTAVYRPRTGARLSEADAQIVGEELSKLSTITAQNVLEAARPDAAALHRFFEWDDVRAAELYREEQARHLVRSVNIVFVEDMEEKETQAFHLVEVDGERQYAPLQRVIDSEELSRQVLERAKAELASWRARYAEYRHHFGAVMEAIDEAADQFVEAPA